MFKLYFLFVILFVYGVVIKAAVIKQTDEVKNVFETTTVAYDNTETTMEIDITTVKGDNSDDNNTESTEKLSALSRDEEATILIIDQTLLDPAPAELVKSEAATLQVEKSGKLLLLSTPKIAEKPKQPEENVDESDEAEDTLENFTQNPIETTTTVVQNEDETTETTTTESEYKQTSLNMTTSMEKITKLYPINDTLYEHKNEFEIKANERSVLTVDDQPKETLNSNIQSIVLEETEADYVLVDSDILEGSYTDIDSDLHLQPIVQSVEIVPSSLDETLLINYVQSW